MNVTEAEARRLLAAARKAGEGIDRARESRRQAVKACMDAGIPRAQIAAELGITRSRLYQILSDAGR